MEAFDKNEKHKVLALVAVLVLQNGFVSFVSIPWIKRELNVVQCVLSHWSLSHCYLRCYC